MIFDFVENIHNYFGISASLDQGLTMILQSDFDALGNGRHEIPNSNAYFMVQQPALKPLVQTRWERHEKFIDIQFSLSAGERIDCLPTRDIKAWEPMDTQRDIAFADETRAGCELSMQKGMFAVFFPQDAHRPCIAMPGAQGTRKVVVKVPAR